MPNSPLPAFVLRPSNSSAVFAERIDGRRIVYFDNNVWIALRDANTPTERACRELCERAADGGLVVFPISFAVFHELWQIPDAGSRRRQAELQDRLCRGVTLRAPQALRAAESAAAYSWLFHGLPLPVRRSHGFTNVVDIVGDGSLEFPAGWRPADVDRLVNDHWLRVSLTDLVSMLPEIDRLRDDYEEATDARHVEQWRAFGAGRKLNRERVLREERTYLFRKHVLPAFRNLLLGEEPDIAPEEINARVEACARGLGKERHRLANLLATVPTLELSAQLFTLRALEPGRKAKAQDFWDLEHAITAPAYVDAFVTADRGLARLVNAAVSNTAACSHVKVLSSLSELRSFIAQLIDRGKE